MRTCTHLMVLALCLVPSVAFAQDADPQSWQLYLAENVLEVVLSLLSVVGTAVGVKLYQYVANKLGLERDAAAEQKIADLVERSIDLAEEKSRQLVRAGKGPMPGQEKQRAAVDAVSKWLRESGLSELAEERLKELVDAKIGRRRNGAPLPEPDPEPEPEPDETDETDETEQGDG